MGKYFVLQIFRYFPILFKPEQQSAMPEIAFTVIKEKSV
jgi:hypothetical protein